MTVQGVKVIVLAEGETCAATGNARGHLFERFVAKILERLGYSEPRTENLNVTDDGIELDVVVRHRLNGRTALAECKAFTSPIAVKELTAFYGKLTTRRLTEGDTDGFFFALPRVTQNGAEQARLIESKDAAFKYLNADNVADVARDLGLVSEANQKLADLIVSDPAIVITEHGIYSARKVLDPDTRTTAEVLVWGSDAVPSPVLELIRGSAYADGMPVRDARMPENDQDSRRTDTDPPMVVEVRGSQSDFEYQLPASPRYFVGRSRMIAELVEEVLHAAPSVVVINAQSGWGKSSLALRLKQSAYQAKGHAAVFDSRTASDRGYVASALRVAALEAERARLFQLPASASWASLASAIDTLRQAQWHDRTRPLLIFFDQFENVFRDEALTREFRDLALGIHEVAAPVVIGFAWKTDLVGWTEDHPYQLRDQIRAQSHVANLSPLGPSEVDTLLRRLEKTLGTKLIPDLKLRLREYSQGLPWLFKKLAGHVLREVQAGTTQGKLVSEALNVQNLFEADLAELQPSEREGLLHIARFAPLPVSEVLERVPANVVRSLVDRRLIVQVGERLDTYWDIFRDFLTTGRIPIEDSYILRMAPVSVGRLLRAVLADGGDVAVADLAARLQTSENVIYNLSREMRLFGAIAYEPNRVRLLDEIRQAGEREDELRRRVASALRRHRAFSTFTRLAEQHGEPVSLAAFSRALPAAFPAVAVAHTTWTMYARVFAQWFDYAGLAIFRNQVIMAGDEHTKPTKKLLAGTAPHRTPGVFPQRVPGPSLALLQELANNGPVVVANDRRRDAASRDLIALGAVTADGKGLVSLKRDDLIEDGHIRPAALRALIEGVPGGPEALAAIERDPFASADILGALLRDAQGAGWTGSTTATMGKNFRAWARAAGVHVVRPSRLRKATRALARDHPSLFA
jgi:Restriction endonuclease